MRLNIDKPTLILMTQLPMDPITLPIIKPIKPDEEKTKAELIAELMALREDVAQLQQVETERHWAEETLRSYLQFLGALLDTIPNPVFYKDKEGFYLGCNNIFAQFIFGIPKEKIIGRSVHEFPVAISSKVAHLDRVQDLELLQTSGIQAYEAQILCADGVERDFIISKATYRDATNQIAGIVGVMSDITERNQMQQRLMQNNLELALLNRTSQEFISSLDLDQVLTNALEEARQLLDVTACSAWLIDPNSHELVCRHATEGQSRSILGWRLAMGQGVVGWVAEHATTLIVPDTRLDERHFKQIDEETGLDLRSILSVPLQIKVGSSNELQVIGVMQVVDNQPNRFSIAEQRLLEPLVVTIAIAIENARLYEQAQRDAKTKAILLSEVNHRVKNNLAAIIGLLYAEQSHAAFEHKVIDQTIFDELINRVQGLAIVHEMLSAAEWSPLPLQELAEQVIGSLLQTISLNIRVVVDISPSPVRVLAEEAHEIALIINELATNSVKYALSARQKNFHIQVTITHQENEIRFEFRDNGPGYPPEILQRKAQHYSVGFGLIEGIVQSSLRGKLSIYNDNGAVSVIQFKTAKDK